MLESLRTSLVSGGEKAQKRKRDDLESMTKEGLSSEGAKYGITIAKAKDAGWARAELFHEYGLGVPRQSGWTKAGIKYILKEVLGHTHAASATRDKQTATDTLVQVLMGMATNQSSGPSASTTSTAPNPVLGSAGSPVMVPASVPVPLLTMPGVTSLAKAWRGGDV